MARPATKDGLLVAAADRFAKLTSLIGSLPANAMAGEFTFADRDRNVRDVLWHLHTWHEMVIEWHRVGTIEGSVPAVPGQGYTWKTLPDLNLKVWQRAQVVSLAAAREALAVSHAAVLRLIESHTNEELFSRGCIHGPSRQRSGPILSPRHPATMTGL